MVNIKKIVSAFGIIYRPESAHTLTSGHINNTYKIEDEAGRGYILQSINTHVFKQPEHIGHNIKTASEHLKKNHPEYLFSSPIPTKDGKEMFYDEVGKPWRIFNYIPDTITIDELESPEQAFNAAKEFARLVCFLSDCDEKDFFPTIPAFHDLNLRYNQFLEAIDNSTPERKKQAGPWIKECLERKHLVDTYKKIIGKNGLKSRITHNDTKINNILFASDRRKAIAVIDLDTLMPGYFFYDLGDMVRTFVSPVSEEEKDQSKIIFRKDIYEALLEGYLSEMASDLSELEKSLIVYSGMMMTFIMALRFLADFLNGDVYYKIHYPEQNLVRSSNQLVWLKVQEQHAREMEEIADRLLEKYGKRE